MLVHIVNVVIYIFSPLPSTSSVFRSYSLTCLSVAHNVDMSIGVSVVKFPGSVKSTNQFFKDDYIYRHRTTISIMDKHSRCNSSYQLLNSIVFNGIKYIFHHFFVFL